MKKKKPFTIIFLLSILITHTQCYNNKKNHNHNISQGIKAMKNEQYPKTNKKFINASKYRDVNQDSSEQKSLPNKCNLEIQNDTFKKQTKKYDKIYCFSKGLAEVELNGKHGYIDKNEKVVIPIKYENSIGSKDGILFIMQLNGKWGLVDKNGKMVSKFKHDRISYFSEGLAKVELNNKYGYINKRGKEVIPPKYDFAFGFKDGLASVSLNGKFGKINKLGKEVVPIKYENSICSSGMKLNGKWGLVDKNGKVISEFKYDYLYCFTEGLASVMLNGKYGFIDKKGKEVIPIKYNGAESFSEGLARIKVRKKENYGYGSKEKYAKYGFIDKRAKIIIPTKYDNAEESFKNGLVRVTLGDKKFYINKQGKCVNDCP